MLCKNVTQENIQQAAESTPGVRIHNLQPANAKGTAFRFQLKTDGDQYLTRSHSGRRVGGAVNYLGFRDYLRALFQVAPAARVETAFATFTSIRDLEAEMESCEIGNRNVGTVAHPYTMIDAVDGTVTR